MPKAAASAVRPGLVKLTAGLGLTVAMLAAGPTETWAGGYDTPMLYSARHMGMGGTAIGYVDDPSALFHNPAGLANVRRFSALGDFSLLLARIRSTSNNPSAAPEAKDLESDRTVAPMFLLGAAHRINDWLVGGLGLYPIASAGATYNYDFVGLRYKDMTRLVFLEASPGAAVNLLSNRLRLGVGYRLTYVSLERFAGSPAKGGTDFKLTGLNATGFRLGAQYTIVPGLSAGAVYRHRTKTKVKNDTGRALGQEFSDVSTEFVLPTKLGFGVRGDWGDVGLGVDFEYLFNGQNDGYPLVGNPQMAQGGMAGPTMVDNVFEWKNEVTWRTGLEYRLLGDPSLGPRPLALRVGYVFDGKTTNPVYPSAFGTPPGPTHVLTAGAGWRFARWQLNLAYGRRFGEGDVTAADVADRPRTCLFCGFPGDKPYALKVNGLYVDVSVALD